MFLGFLHIYCGCACLYASLDIPRLIFLRSWGFATLHWFLFNGYFIPRFLQTSCKFSLFRLFAPPNRNLDFRINTVSGVTVLCLAVIFFFQGSLLPHIDLWSTSDCKPVSIVRMLYRSSRQIRATNQSSYYLSIRVTAFTAYSFVTFVYVSLPLK